jgi:hypothetical protein
MVCLKRQRRGVGKTGRKKEKREKPIFHNLSEFEDTQFILATLTLNSFE